MATVITAHSANTIIVPVDRTYPQLTICFKNKSASKNGTMIMTRRSLTSGSMGAKSPYNNAPIMNTHKMIFNNVAERDLSSSPSKTGGPNHRRKFDSMKALLILKADVAIRQLGMLIQQLSFPRN